MHNSPEPLEDESLRSPHLKRLFPFPAVVVALGLVSLFTDLSSEMIYPLLPVFLSSVLGAGALALGIIEGLAESTAALLKVVSGIWTDRTRRRKPLILAGYGLAGLARPLIGLANSWPFVMWMRFLDRVGKGLRTSPRDALVADVTTPDRRGRAYGFHRAMDHAGAVGGPLVAAALLSWGGLQLRHVFLLAAIPAAAAVSVVVAGVREPARSPGWTGPAPARLFRRNWQDLGREFRFLLVAFFVFTLGNSSDTFLLLSLSGSGVGPAWVAVLWALHHVVKMAASYLGGHLSDRTNPRLPILAGWMLYALVYVGFGMSGSVPAKIALFMLYGIYFGLTEPAEKAWVSQIVPEHLLGSAFGYYHAVVGIGAFPASIIFGFLWQARGDTVAFFAGAGFAACAAVLLLMLPPCKAPKADPVGRNTAGERR